MLSAPSQAYLGCCVKDEVEKEKETGKGQVKVKKKRKLYVQFFFPTNLERVI